MSSKVKSHNTIPLLSKYSSGSLGSKHREQSKGRMWVVFKVCFPSVQRQTTHFKSVFLFWYSLLQFSSPWTIVFQRSFKAKFPLNAVIAYSSCKGQTLWEMFKRLPLSVFFSFLPSACIFLRGFWCLCKQGRRYGQFMRERPQETNQNIAAAPRRELPSLSSQFRWQDITLTPAHLISSERNFSDRKSLISSAWSKPDKHDYNAIKPFH